MTAITHIVRPEAFTTLARDPGRVVVLLCRSIIERYAEAMVETPDMKKGEEVLTLDTEVGREHASHMMDAFVVPSAIPFRHAIAPQRPLEIYIPLEAFQSLYDKKYSLDSGRLNRLFQSLGYEEGREVSLIGSGDTRYTPSGIVTDDQRVVIYPTIGDKGGGFVHIPSSDEDELERVTVGIKQWLQGEGYSGAIEGILTDHSTHTPLSIESRARVNLSGYDKPHRVDPSAMFQMHIRSVVGRVLGEFEAWVGPLEPLEPGNMTSLVLLREGFADDQFSSRVSMDFQSRDRYHFA